MFNSSYTRLIVALFLLSTICLAGESAEDWTQFKGDARHSGNLPDRSIETPLSLVGAVPLTDAIFTSPVVADGRVYIVDGSGVVFCIDAKTLDVIWTFESGGGSANCNNVSSPVIADEYLHFGTMAGIYYVLDRENGKVVKEIPCGEPIFSTPVASNRRVYFATLGSQIYALEPDGEICWTWDYVKERLGFSGNRWSGEEWRKHKEGRVTWRDQFCCSRDIAADGDTVVIPAGGETIWLEDRGRKAELKAVGLVPKHAGSESPATFGISLDEDGAVYRQWHRRDNTGRVEVLRLKNGEVGTDYVPGTETADDMPWLLSFCSVSIRGEDVYRCRPEVGFGFCKHRMGGDSAEYLGGYPSIASPILLRDNAVYGGLDGKVYVVPLSGNGKVWSFETAFGNAISAPVAVCDGRVYVCCEDGYLYILGPDGEASLPTRDLGLWKIRSAFSGELDDPKYDWFTNYGNLQGTNSNDQGVEPPFKIKWIRRYEGTFKHIPVCGGDRMYTHTAEGQVFAVEQETGRLLWRRYFPGVHVSYTSPIYYNGKLLVPQAGLKKSRLRCFDATTGKLLWEAPFTGSPSWSRQLPPVIHNGLAIYQFSTGEYVAKGSGIYVMRMNETEELPEETEGSVSWLYSHDNPFYPSSQKPLVRAWDIETGEEVWTRDFSEFGSGGDDAALCLMDGVLYYSCFFGYSARTRRGLPGPRGITAAMDPTTGDILWLTTQHSITAGCSLTARDGCIYLGGYNPPNTQTDYRYVWCLDAKDGSLIWQSDPLVKAINVVTAGKDFIFAFAYGSYGYLIDKKTGEVFSKFDKDYACTRFTLSEPYIIGCNMDVIDTTNGNELVSSGPAVDVRECVGSSVSNGRIFYTTQGSGLQVSQVCGDEARSFEATWEKMKQ